MTEPTFSSQDTGGQFIGSSGSRSERIRGPAHVRIHPKKLYGRSTEVAKLLQAYRRMTDRPQETQRPEFVVISGPAGVGKTALAQSLKKPVTDDDGYFIRGKFDAISSRGVPYTAFIAAFEEWTSLVVSRGVEARNAMRECIRTTVPDYSRILIDMIPCLAQIIASEEEAPHANSPARMRFAFVFRKFVRALCSPQRPLVLLLDDVDCADQSSLDLLSTLIPDCSNEGIMFVVTCKDAQPDSPLSKLLCRLEEANVLVTRLRLLNLHDDTVNSIVADLLELPTLQTKYLSDFIYQETTGNVNFALTFMGSLQEKGLLRFDEANQRWVVSEQGIYEEMESYNVGELVVERMMRQPQSLLEVLKVASALGSLVDKLVIDKVFGTCVARHLFVASEFGFLVFDSQLERYSFSHNEVESAAYSLIPKDEKRFFHLSVGRKLRRNLSEDEFRRNIFVVMNQFRLGADHIQSEQEKCVVAELCLQTAELAVSASSFPTASLYLELGIHLLDESSCWTEHYALSLALFNTAAEVNYCTGDFERVETLLAAVFANATSFRDKLRAYDSHVYTLGATDRMEEAINVGLDVLCELGEPIPPNPTPRRVKRESRRMKRITDAKSDETLLRLPTMRDPDKLSVMKMMSLIFLYAYLCRPQLAGFLTVRMMRLTLDSGLSAMTSSLFSMYGMLLCSSLGDVNEGYRFGSLALALLEKFKVSGLAWLPRVYAGMYACISPWTRPFREVQEPLKRSVTIGLEFGDIEYSMLNANLYCFNLIEEGRTLPFIQSEIQTFSETMTLQKQESALLLIRSFSGLIENLMGQKDDLVSATGQLCFDQVSTVARAEKSNAMNNYGINFAGAILSFLFADYSLALQLIVGCHGILQHPLAGFDKCSVAYWTSLVSLALAAASAGNERAKHLSRSRRYRKMLDNWVLDSPHNVLPGLSLLEAEYASVAGNSKLAYAKYLVAISLAKTEGMLNAECIMNERAGRHFVRQNDFTNATPFLQRAHDLYLEWGAQVKADHLKNEFSHCIK